MGPFATVLGLAWPVVGHPLGQFGTIFGLADIFMFRTKFYQFLIQEVQPFAEYALRGIMCIKMPREANSANGCTFLIKTDKNLHGT